MEYKSTRGAENGVSSAFAIKQGLASDGGLFMPCELPQITQEEIRTLCGMTYPQRAAYILGKYLTDYTAEELRTDCEAAYDDNRFPGGAAPLHKLRDGLHVLELWHGPTCAFKDMALQIMPKLLSRALVKTGEKRDALILVATSGDTGKAALEGYRDVPHTKMLVYYPVDGVSRIQKLQMATQEGGNVSVCSVRGNFDDAQNGVKRIFSDASAAQLLSEHGYILSSANSINWGRLAPQIVYYVSAYCDLINSGEITAGDEINVTVPTGNFGNIFAAYLARRAGLPIHRLVCASNCNNILTDFLQSGTYDRNRAFHTTMSPSMDILISSNLERMLYLAAGSERTTQYMRALSEQGVYTVDADVKKALDDVFTGKFCSEENTAQTIRRTFENEHYLIDTHTAVGLFCAEEYAKEDARPMVAVSTASPYKFASSVLPAISGKKSDDEFENLAELNRVTGAPIPAPLASLAGKTIRFDPEAAIEADQMRQRVLDVLGIS